MGKRVSFPTRSLGSHVPAPDRQALAEWIGTRRGRAADLLTYQVEEGLRPQLEAGINAPCAGGRFYRDRWISSLRGIDATSITGEVDCDLLPVVQDAEELDTIRKGLWLAVPSPLELRLEDRYFHDSEEAAESLFDAYHEMMRAMRDAGIAGHVLLCEKPVKEELEAFSGGKVFFFSNVQTEKTLALLLEYQSVVAVQPPGLGLIRDLMGEYGVQKVVLLDATEGDLIQALEFMDTDNLVCGGYCQESCSRYWISIVKNASIFR